VVCTRSPVVSPSSIATLPGVISAFSSNLLAVDHLDPDRLVLEPRVGARRGDDDFLFDARHLRIAVGLLVRRRGGSRRRRGLRLRDRRVDRQREQQEEQKKKSRAAAPAAARAG
jgi:hypothetical protein